MRRSFWPRCVSVALVMLLAGAPWGMHGDSVAWAEVRNARGVALIIGNMEYEHRDVPDVTYAHRDADAFKGYVLGVLGFDPANVIDLRDARRRQLFDALGTRSDPLGSLLWSYLHPEGGSDVVVFYSGHGVPGQRDKRGYLLPVDADPKAAEDDGYPIDLLYENLGKLAEARSVRVFLDACFSGGTNDGGLIGSASPVFVKASLPVAAAGKVTSLTAASGEQIASWDDEAKHGLFTHHLLEALYGKGDADRDGKVTAEEAKGYLDRWMTRAARRKHRRVQKANLMGSGEVVLASVSGGEGFPGRPESGAATGGTGEVKGKGEGTAGAGGAAGRPVTPGVSALKVSDHEAVEEALGLDRAGRVLIQRGLAELGLGVGYADGLFGKKTRGAIREWQDGKGMAATGHLTGEQAEALKALGEEVARAEAARAEKEKAERERLAREAAERERKAREKAEAERKARELAERERLRPGREFRDCEGCPEMVVVPAGEYMMGSLRGEAGRGSDEGPRHWVRIGAAFGVGKYEVTFEEWAACVSDGGCGGYWPGDEGWGRGRRPVIEVSWEDAKRYVEWLSRKTGEEYRLLSEAEWEYVARAGTTGPFHYGWTIATEQANYDGNYSYGTGTKGEYRRRTVRVGSFGANGFGLHDVHGNVWEWVEDCWHGDYSGAPDDGSAWTSGGDCGRRVVRGGSWYSKPRYLRSSYRSWYSAGYRENFNGFRVARTLTP